MIRFSQFDVIVNNIKNIQYNRYIIKIRNHVNVFFV